jgi:hypothetical protein
MQYMQTQNTLQETKGHAGGGRGGSGEKSTAKEQHNKGLWAWKQHSADSRLG